MGFLGCRARPRMAESHIGKCKVQHQVTKRRLRVYIVGDLSSLRSQAQRLYGVSLVISKKECYEAYMMVYRRGLL